MIGTGSKYIKHVDDFLTLDGLRIIWERNAAARPGLAPKSPVKTGKNSGAGRAPSTPRAPR
jgi:hypothetical protein